MKTGFVVEVQVGRCIYEYTFNVVANTAEQAIKKAIAAAKKESGRRTGWRCTALTEAKNAVVL